MSPRLAIVIGWFGVVAALAVVGTWIGFGMLAFCILMSICTAAVFAPFMGELAKEQALPVVDTQQSLLNDWWSTYVEDYINTGRTWRLEDAMSQAAVELGRPVTIDAILVAMAADMTRRSGHDVTPAMVAHAIVVVASERHGGEVDVVA